MVLCRGTGAFCVEYPFVSFRYPVTTDPRLLLTGVSLAVLLPASAALAADGIAVQAAGAVVDIPTIQVTGATPSAETEGTGSYAASAATVAGKLPIPLKAIPNSVSVITRQMMDDWNSVTLHDSLTLATGVTPIPNDGTQSQYGSRGYGMNVMFNGVPSYNALGGSQQFDMDIYDRVEVLRGTAGMLLGTDPNPGGTVNLVTKRARKTFGATARASYGSWNNARGMADVTGPLNADGSLRARLVASSQHREFFYDHASARKQVVYGTIEYDAGPNTTLSLSTAYQHDRASPFYGIPVYANLTIPNTSRSQNPLPPWAKNDTDTIEQTAAVEHRFDSGWVAKAQARWWQRYYRYHDGYAASPLAVGTDTFSLARSEGSYNYVRQGIDVYAGGPFTLLGRTHHALVGYNRDVYQYDYTSGTAPTLTGVRLFDLHEGSAAWQEPVINPTSGGKSYAFQEGFYGQLRLKVLDPLTLVGGARIANFTTRSRGTWPSTPTDWRQGAKRDNQFVPYGGVIVDVTKDIAVYASMSQIFIPQTQTDYTGRTLDPRYGTQYEAGVKGAFLGGKLNATAALFRIEDTNRAFADPDHINYFLQSGEVRSEGFDAEVTGSPLAGLELTAGYTYLSNTYVTDARNQGVNFSNWYPKHSIKLLAMKRFDDGVLDGFNIGAGLTVSTRTGGNGSNAALEQPAYAVANLQAGYRITDSVSAALTVNNLFDEKYFAALGRSLNTYNIYGEPRNVLLTITATY